ncbi:Golgi transport complex subunit COG1 LALA0_S06e07668g [Lachancea lanzarotensis]|uniref:LALA0S06e07668g1_1 n=1 Tax=Lachancea lanzarotensis TaxID=1245769 RepID=A0A0C7N4S4_9SACH|nr:uncharacterized protein LALA0_S06e07668g [Lachancea lanzarotensis]CEP62952.1 LALA0S06e07668g1_1 [Lachancea lanzarotensis]
MATTAETLFREKSVVEVRDYNLNLTQEIARARDTFEFELGKRYTDILAVTDEVEVLLQEARLADASLMDLCFNDSKCKLETVSEPVKELGTPLGLNGFNSASIVGSEASSEAHCTLAVSEWVLAVLALVQDPGSLKNLDLLVSKFGFINKVSVPEQFNTVIADKCKLLESAVLQHALSLTASHWVRLQKLFHDYQESPLFEFKQIHAIDELAFDFLLGNEDYLQRSVTDAEVQTFFKTPVYRAKSIERALKLIDEQFRKYESNDSSGEQSDLALYDDTDEESLQLFVKNVDLYCKGVITIKDQRLEALVERVIETIAKLKTSRVEANVLADIKNRLATHVQARLAELENDYHDLDVVALEVLDGSDAEQLSKEGTQGSNELAELPSVRAKGEGIGTTTESSSAKPHEPHETLSEVKLENISSGKEATSSNDEAKSDKLDSVGEEDKKSQGQFSEQIGKQDAYKESSTEPEKTDEPPSKEKELEGERTQPKPTEKLNQQDESEASKPTQIEPESPSLAPNLTLPYFDGKTITLANSNSLVNTSLDITNASNLKHHLEFQIQQIRLL